MTEIDDDVPQLSAETFTALLEFYKEKEDREKEANLLITDEVDLEENWQLSQFWYNEPTINSLTKIAIDSVGKTGKIALISCPSLYKKIKATMEPDGEVHLYEYDKRFQIYGEDYINYDYKSPLDIPRDKSSYYNLVIADPPFLSEECLCKTAVTVRYLAKDKIILCTGQVMLELAERLLNLKRTGFEPKHKHNLGNEFCCYTNYNIDDVME